MVENAKLIYKGLKGDKIKNIKRGIILGLTCIGVTIALIMTRDKIMESPYLYFGIIIMAVISGLGAYSTFFGDAKTYKFIDEGILIIHPILSRNIIYYSSIIDVKKANNKEIEKILRGGWDENHKEDIIEKNLPSFFGKGKIRYKKAETTDKKTVEDMKLSMMSAYCSRGLYMDTHFEGLKEVLDLNVPEGEYVIIKVSDDDYFESMEYILSPEKIDEFVAELKQRISQKKI